MRRSSAISILRYCNNHSFNPQKNPYNPHLYSFSRALHSHKPPLFAGLEIHTPLLAQIHFPSDQHFEFSFRMRNFCSHGGISSDFAAKSCGSENMEDESSVDELYTLIMENAGYGKNLEDALERAELPLTTDLVLGTLHRLRFEEKIAFRFFMWVGQREHYQHEYRVYNEMIDILSCTKFKAKQFRIVCDLLDYLKRNDKKWVSVEVVLSILKRYTEKHLTKTKKCAKRNRVRVIAQPEVKALNLLLDSLCKCFLVETAETMFKKVRSKVKPDADTFNVLFFGWCRVRNPTRGKRVLEEMSEAGFTPDSFTYNTAIDTYCKAEMLAEARELFEFMKREGSTICANAKTYAIMILALVKDDRIEDCFEVVGDMIRSGCLPDVSSYKELIEGICLAGKVEEAYRFLEEMAKKGFPPDIVTYNCFLKVLCDNKMASQAMQLYGRMVEVGCVPSVHTFNMLMEMFFALGDPDGAFEAWDEMDKRGCFRDINTYCVMIEGLFGCGKVDGACSLLEDVVKRGMKLPYRKYDFFLTQLSELGNLRAIHSLSEHMKGFYNPGMARRFAMSQKRKSLSLRGN